MVAGLPISGWFHLLASWSNELLSAADRVDHLIGNHHQPTKGSYREALLRNLLRRVLPDRFRVSTGFIYRGHEEPSSQIDILIWDAQNHAALLEEGELAILTPDSVAAIIEVKSTLSYEELRKALKLLSPTWWDNWRYTAEDSCTGLPQQVPNVPFRAIFAYSAERTTADRRAELLFFELASFYKQRFGADAGRALKHKVLIWNGLI